MDFHQEFPLDPDIFYLNHAAVAPWPKRTAEAVQNFAKENCHEGSKHYLNWLQQEQTLREQLQELINAKSSDEIALLKSTSEGLSVIAYGLEWQSGDEIIISDEEFPSNRIVWESLAQFGVNLKQVTLGDNPEAALEKAITDKTRLLSISSVQYASGAVMDLNKLGKICAANQILFCVDAIQSLGVIPFDVIANQADFVVADGHKWMHGPEGLAVFYCKQDKQDLLKLNQYGWHMIKNPGDYTTKDWDTSETATRFECGSPNMLGIHALSSSLSLLLEVGIKEISQKTIELHEYLRQQLKHQGYEILSPITKAGITTFKAGNIDHQALYKSLMSKNVVCAYRGGGIRFSPNFYQDKSVIDGALKVLSECAQELNES